MLIVIDLAIIEWTVRCSDRSFIGCCLIMSFINKRPTKVEVFHYYNSLVCIPKALIGRYTLIDLRDDSCVSGRITDVDGYMNVQMEDVVFYNNRGKMCLNW